MWDKGIRFLLQRILLSAVALCCLVPLLFLLWGALRREGSFSLGQFEEVLLYTYPFFAWFWNSVKYTLAILAIHIPISILAGFGFSQHSFPGKKALFALYMILMLLPFQATLVPQYLILQDLELLDTPWAVILPNAFGAFGPFLMTQFMGGIDPEILQAARLDGAGDFQLLLRVVMPLCKPAVAAITILMTITCWSLIDQPLLFLRSETLLPLSLELGSRSFGQAAFAAGVVFAVLPLLIYLLFRDKLEEGICLSSIK